MAHRPSLERQVAGHLRLLWTFVVRDMRARYAGSALGIFWSVVHPLIMLFVYIVVFSTLVRGGRFNIRGAVADYAIFLCPAIIAWNWFNESVMGASAAITGNSSLIRKVVFPSEILPLNPVIAGLLPFVVAMALFLAFAGFKGVFHPATLLYLPLVAVLQIAVTVGPAYLFAALNVFVRDTTQLLSAGLQILFWGTPIVYTEETLTTPFPLIRYWFEINPVAHLVGAYRDAIIAHRPPALHSVIYLLVIGILTYHLGRSVFTRSRPLFPDEV